MSDSLVDYFYKKIIVNEVSNPGKELADFFCKLYSKPLSQQYIILFSKLVKLWGREIAFYSIIDIYDIESVDFEKSLYPLFAYLCKRKFEEKTKTVQTTDLSSEIEHNLKLAEEVKSLGLSIPTDKEK